MCLRHVLHSADIIKALHRRPFGRRGTSQVTFPTLFSPWRRPNRRSIDTVEISLSHFFPSLKQSVDGSPSEPTACVSKRPTTACVTQIYANDPSDFSSFSSVLFTYFCATLPLSWVPARYRPILQICYSRDPTSFLIYERI